MFGSEILDVAIGLAFVYILVSVMCSAIRESLETFLKTRSAHLEFGLRQILRDPKAEGVVKALYEHPLIWSLFYGEYKADPLRKKPGLFTRGRNLPSYIPARNFALALMDIAARGQQTNTFNSHPGSPAISFESVRASVLNLQNTAVQRALLTALDAAEGDLDRARKNLEEWFDSAMDRVSGWYKRSTQYILFVIGLTVAITLNIDTIGLTQFLYTNDAARTAIVARAEQFAANPDTTSAGFRAQMDVINAESERFGLPFGWGVERTPEGHLGWLTAILGWLLTAFAATLGAPFWFDVLNKVMVIRSTVKPHEKSPEEASEDRQPPAPHRQEVPAPQGPPADTGGGSANPPAGGAPAPPPPSTPNGASIAGDPESDVDGCDVEIAGETSDEDLPAAEGGVEAPPPDEQEQSPAAGGSTP